MRPYLRSTEYMVPSLRKRLHPGPSAPPCLQSITREDPPPYLGKVQLPSRSLDSREVVYYLAQPAPCLASRCCTCSRRLAWGPMMRSKTLSTFTTKDSMRKATASTNIVHCFIIMRAPSSPHTLIFGCSSTHHMACDAVAHWLGDISNRVYAVARGGVIAWSQWFGSAQSHGDAPGRPGMQHGPKCNMDRKKEVFQHGKPPCGRKAGLYQKPADKDVMDCDEHAP
ncbi:hypothetical protein TgHK011_001975 [Trichoderma gracile]|nr:hypothetical protein TgHK011_001975 [Trichoderma gracile]